VVRVLDVAYDGGVELVRRGNDADEVLGDGESRCLAAEHIVYILKENI